jgi:hypothetical protein
VNVDGNGALIFATAPRPTLPGAWAVNPIEKQASIPANWSPNYLCQKQRCMCIFHVHVYESRLFSMFHIKSNGKLVHDQCKANYFFYCRLLPFWPFQQLTTCASSTSKQNSLTLSNEEKKTGRAVMRCPSQRLNYNMLNLRSKTLHFKIMSMHSYKCVQSLKLHPKCIIK